MKKLITLISVYTLVLAYSGASAQCVIDNLNSSPGFSPASLSCITQNSSYGEAVQIYVPAGFGSITIDSINVSGVNGLPTGIGYSFNPSSGTIVGGAHGCIWFSGTTSDTVGHYSLTFSGTAYTSLGALPLSTPSLSAIFNYALNVCPAPVSICDTLFNLVSVLDTPEIYVFGDGSYLSGNNSYGDLAKAEAFTVVPGAQVSGAYLSFGYVTINPSDSDNTVTVYAWDDSGTQGSPGTAIDSASISLRDIATEVSITNDLLQPQFVYVPFTAGATLTGASFYVGVELPTTGGDTIALLTSSQAGGHDGKGWEEILNPDPVWISYQSDYDSVFGNYIAAVACITGNYPLAAFSATPNSGCEGDTVQFTDLSSYGPASWLWSFPGGNPSSSIAQSPKVVYSAAGSYNAKLVVSNFYGSDSVTHNGAVTIHVTPDDTVVSVTPASSATTADGSVTVTGILGTGPYTYMWSNTDTGATLSNVLPGVYSMTVTDHFGCKYVEDTVLVTYTTGINAIAGNSIIKIYPNPAGEELNIEWSTVPDAEISIIDVNGKIVREFASKGSMLNTFDIHDLSSGAYVIRINDRKTNQHQSAVFNKL